MHLAETLNPKQVGALPLESYDGLHLPQRVNMAAPEGVFPQDALFGSQRPPSIGPPTMPYELPKQFDPQEAQQRWLKFWHEKGYYHSDPDWREKYCVVIPPPNVTGALHLGHAINDGLQDMYVRWRRMQQYNTLWVPGTDHAGIATQAVVERLLLEQEKKTRHDLGREELVRRIWQWKEKYEARILDQLKQLGFSCDWQRTRFTLDEGCTKAVRKTFFDLFKEGFIFRGKRLVNWDTHLQTAVADDELYHEPVKGSFWTFKYAIQGTSEFIRFSTTRPETMLGDVAIAVHPNDERYKHLVGKMALQPLVNREIPIIADGMLVDPALGTGAVKVTPAHDFNDYQCGLRHKLPMLNILTPDGKINDVGGKYAGVDRAEARKRTTADMEALGLLEKVEDREIELAHSDRSKTPVEPYLSDQWFVKMGDHDDGKPGLAQRAMNVVQNGTIKFFPERYAKTYLDWLGEKRDWCISRQLWWGHRIPIWYAKCEEADLQKAFARRHDVTWRRSEDGTQWLICCLDEMPTSDIPMSQDEDVLDTWFSSALWPHAVLGWPSDTPEMKYYYPTDALITSRDIITLWVARMVMMSLFNLGKIPFNQVHIHPKILDGFGETMSKSKGNGVDPIDIINIYGVDALRFGLALLATETQDAKMPVTNLCPHCGEAIPVKHEHMYLRTKKLTCPKCKQPFRPGGPWPSEDPELKTAKQGSERFEIGRNFATKLWNAARFLLLNMDGYTPGPVPLDQITVEDRWILGRLAQVNAAVTAHLEKFQMADAARLLYDFAWSEFCDWYVEMCKTRLKQENTRPLAQRMLVGVLDFMLRLLHPIMPFVTESIWQALNEVCPQRGLPAPGTASESLMIAPWPQLPIDALRDPGVEQAMTRMQDLVRMIRNIRNQFMVDEKASVDVTVHCTYEIGKEFMPFAAHIVALAKVGCLHVGPDHPKPKQAAAAIHADFTAYVHLVGLIDVAAETKRLQKQLADKEKQLSGVRGKLANASFLERAAPEVVQQTRDQERDLQTQLEAIKMNLHQLQGT
jgi:valyl-tRNA synthetase